jgi:putative effector of murein hydrolase LrgA (UPF0299 family)
MFKFMQFLNTRGFKFDARSVKSVLLFVMGVALLLASYYAGELLSILIGGFVSPAVLGMLILFLLLKFRIVQREWVESAASFLLDNLMLFFIPVTAGVALVPFSSLREEFPAIILSVVVSSFIVLWVVSSIVQKFDSGRNDEY